MKTLDHTLDHGIVVEYASQPSGSVRNEALNDQEGAIARTRALERIASFFRFQSHIVLEGEPGVGKKFHAALLHAQAPSRGEFVEITAENPVETLRAILFDEDRKLVEEMAGKRLPTLQGRSTLFVRNIGEFSIIQQTVLSRFIIQQQQNEQQAQRSQARVVISAGISWSELLARKVLIDSLVQSVRPFEVCSIPPLRVRVDEIPSLVQTFLVDLRRREKIDCWRVKEETLEQLKACPWRDNIRELKYIIESAAINSSDGTLRLPNRLFDEIDQVFEIFRTIQSGKRLTIEQSLAALEKSIVERALVKYNFDLRKTARMLAMTEPNLTYRIKKFNIYIPTPAQ